MAARRERCLILASVNLPLAKRVCPPWPPCRQLQRKRRASDRRLNRPIAGCTNFPHGMAEKASFVRAYPIIHLRPDLNPRGDESWPQSLTRSFGSWRRCACGGPTRAKLRRTLWLTKARQRTSIMNAMPHTGACCHPADPTTTENLQCRRAGGPSRCGAGLCAIVPLRQLRPVGAPASPRAFGQLPLASENT
jgi:hypothetical protein